VTGLCAEMLSYVIAMDRPEYRTSLRRLFSMRPRSLAALTLSDWGIDEKPSQRQSRVGGVRQARGPASVPAKRFEQMG
jgi:hypothetical protein